MKRLILCIAIMGAITFAACEKDDSSNENCVTCRFNSGGITDSEEVCNVDGMAYVNGTNSNTAYSDYIDLAQETGYSCR